MLDKDAKESHPFTQRGKMTKTPHLFCSLCQAVPYDYHLDERGNIQGKLFATIRDLKNHYISYHDFEFTDMDPEFDQDFTETLTWSFGICEECDALCLTEKSLKPEGNPDAYDLDKVLRELNEVPFLNVNMVVVYECTRM